MCAQSRGSPYLLMSNSTEMLHVFKFHLGPVFIYLFIYVIIACYWCRVTRYSPLGRLFTVLRWICDALRHSDDMTSFQGVVQHKQAWPELSKFCSSGWFSVKETEPGAFCPLKQTLLIAGDVHRLCEAYKWVSVWFKDGSALHAPSNWTCVWKLLGYFPHTVSATCASSLSCGFLKQCLELALCVKVVQYVLCVLQLSECDRGGRGR